MKRAVRSSSEGVLLWLLRHQMEDEAWCSVQGVARDVESSVR